MMNASPLIPRVAQDVPSLSARSAVTNDDLSLAVGHLEWSRGRVELIGLALKQILTTSGKELGVAERNVVEHAAEALLGEISNDVDVAREIIAKLVE